MTDVLGPELEDTQPRAAVAAARRTGRRWTRRHTVIAAGAAVLVAAGAVAIVPALGHGAGTPTQHATVAQEAAKVTTLPGWGTTAKWTATGAKGDIAVTSDGKAIAYVHGHQVILLTASSGKVKSSTTIPGTITGVYPAQVGGQPAIVAYASKSVVTWSGAGYTASSTARGNGTKLQLRGEPFLIDGTTTSLLAANGPTPITSPRPGAAVLTAGTGGQVLWASARGEVLTAAANGSIVRTAKLAAPKRGATITAWVTANTDTVWVRWKTTDGSVLLTAHNTHTGAVVSSVTANPRGAAATSQDTTDVLVDGTPFTKAGKPITTPTSFVPTLFVGDELYGATKDGKTALLRDGHTVTTTPPTVIPVAVTANRDLVTVADGHIATYPRTK